MVEDSRQSAMYKYLCKTIAKKRLSGEGAAPQTKTSPKEGAREVRRLVKIVCVCVKEVCLGVCCFVCAVCLCSCVCDRCVCCVNSVCLTNSCDS